MASDTTTYGTVCEGEIPAIALQVIKPGGALMLIADLDCIEVQVFDDERSKTQPIFEDTLVPADWMFDTPQVDLDWDEDEVGYNFLYEGDDETLIAVGGRIYRYEIQFIRLTGSTPSHTVKIRSKPKTP